MPSDLQLAMLDPEICSRLFHGQDRKKRYCVTSCQLSLGSKQDLPDLVHRLGLYHFFTSRLDIHAHVFCLKWCDVDCVKPNALDTGLVFYFGNHIPNWMMSSQAEGLMA